MKVRLVQIKKILLCREEKRENLADIFARKVTEHLGGNTQVDQKTLSAHSIHMPGPSLDKHRGGGTRVDGGVGLDDATDGPPAWGCDHAAKSGDDALRERVVQPEGVADGQHLKGRKTKPLMGHPVGRCKR